MYAVECRSLKDANRFMKAIPGFIERSRFTVQEVFIAKISKRLQIWYVQLKKVRLKKSKPYCGAHAGACVLKHDDGHQDPKRIFLEGSDWVAFNDMVNDCLDRLKMTADVTSDRATKEGRLYARKGDARRLDYMKNHATHGDFFAHGAEYGCFIGKKSPPSKIEPGTPGVSTWKQPRPRVKRIAVRELMVA
jgi:hypothetical protein